MVAAFTDLPSFLGGKPVALLRQRHNEDISAIRPGSRRTDGIQHPSLGSQDHINTVDEPQLAV
jgi:hypothetical protein